MKLTEIKSEVGLKKEKSAIILHVAIKRTPTLSIIY